jgi:hypothetical protein
MSIFLGTVQFMAARGREDLLFPLAGHLDNLITGFQFKIISFIKSNELLWEKYDLNPPQ